MRYVLSVAFVLGSVLVCRSLVHGRLGRTTRALTGFLGSSTGVRTVRHTTILLTSDFGTNNGILSYNGNNSRYSTVRFTRRLANHCHRGHPNCPTVTVSSIDRVSYINGSFNFGSVFSHCIRTMNHRNSMLLKVSASNGSTGIVGTVTTTHRGKVGIVALANGSNNGVTNATSVRVHMPRFNCTSHVRRVRVGIVRVLVRLVRGRVIGWI